MATRYCTVWCRTVRYGTVQSPYCPCGTVRYRTVPVPYRTVWYRTVRYRYRTVRCDTVTVPYRTVPHGQYGDCTVPYGTAPYGTITRRHVVLLKTATIYVAKEDTYDIYVKFPIIIKCRCCPIDHRAAMGVLMSYLKLGISPGFHD